jgi:hydrogenase maturation protease
LSKDPGTDWLALLGDLMAGSGTVHFVGVGSEVRQDDAVGIQVVSSLLKRMGQSPRRGVRIHPPSRSPERLLSDLASRGERVVVFDAVEARREPGSIVFARLSETKFGFFATHNLPLRLLPGVSEHQDAVFVVGVQPEAMDVGEGLSKTVMASSERLVAAVTRLVEGTR